MRTLRLNIVLLLLGGAYAKFNSILIVTWMIRLTKQSGVITDVHYMGLLL